MMRPSQAESGGLRLTYGFDSRLPYMSIDSYIDEEIPRSLIALDIDDVKGDFVGGFVKWHNLEFETSFRYEEWHSYHFEEVLGGSREQAIEKVRWFYQTSYFIDMPVIAGAKEGVAHLYKTSDLVAVTGRNPVAEKPTKVWLAREFPQMSDVYFTDAFERNKHNKSEVCLRLGAREIVEDNRENAIECAAAGIGAVLLTRPWNSGPLPKRVIRVSSWDEVYGALEELRKYK